MDMENLFEIKNNKEFKVTFSPLGASIYSIAINDDVLTLTPKNFSDFSKPMFFYGKTVGPMCARQKDGKYIVDGKDYYLVPNEPNNICLHSGPNGYSNKIFDYHVIKENKATKVVFTLFVKDMSIGFPGDVNLEVIYTIKDDSYDLELETRFISSKDTLVSLTNHAFFNLNEKHLSDLSLRINASNQVQLSKINLLPDDKLTPVDNVTDFRKLKNIFKDLKDPSIFDGKQKGYDHNYALDEVNINIPSVTLKGNAYQLDIYTDYDGVQIYSCNYNDNIEYLNVEAGLYHGIAIEPQDALTSVKVLPKNNQLVHKTIYRFTKLA